MFCWQPMCGHVLHAVLVFKDKCKAKTVNKRKTQQSQQVWLKSSSEEKCKTGQKTSNQSVILHQEHFARCAKLPLTFFISPSTHSLTSVLRPACITSSVSSILNEMLLMCETHLPSGSSLTSCGKNPRVTKFLSCCTLLIQEKVQTGIYMKI